MATDLKTAPKHELFVEQQLDRVSKRLHALDLGRLGLLLLALVMAHALVMALIDLAAGPKAGSWVTAIRLSVWGVSLAAALLLGILFLVRLFSRINPYFAAKQIEETIPDAKNSVVNWLDLREQPLAPVIKTALGLRAARDLKATDPDRSIHAKKNTWPLMLGIGGLLVALMALLAAEPGRFGSLMQRAFLPLGEITLGTRTRITLLQPAKGDLTVTPEQKIVFEVKITGVVPRINTPQEARLLYRYQADQSWAYIPFEEERDGSWTAIMQSDRVQNGFTYKIAANDAETPEYQVTVQSRPGYAVDKPFEVNYHYPTYLRMPDRRVTFPNEDRGFPEIKGPAGTEVTFIVRTNRELHNAKIELNYPNSMKEIAGTILADDPKAFQVKFTLETSGQLHVRFVTQVGEANSDNAPYNLFVVPDRPPTVELRKPGKDIELSANGTLPLEGFISDDYGIKHVVLRLEVERRYVKTTLAPKNYRPEKSFRFEDGSYADRLDYRDFVALSQLQGLKGESMSLAKGDVLYYWLEATDNCDYPEGKANVGHSKIFKVTILDSQDTEKQRAEQRQAEREQKNHEKRQDEDLRQQEIDRKQKQQEQNRADNQQDPANAAEQQKRENDVLNRLKNQIEKDRQGQGGDNQPSDNGAQNQKSDQPGQGQKKELSQKDVDRLQEMLKKDGPLSELAERELKDAAQGAKSEEVRQAADKALKDRPAQPPREPTPQDIDKLKDMLKDDGQLGNSAAQELAKAAKNSKDPAVKKAAEEALKDAKPGQLDPSQKKDLTEKDLAQLKEMLNKDPGALKDLAQRELKDAAEKSSKDEIKQAAEDALKNAENSPSRQLSPKDIDELKKILEDKGPLGDAARKELAKAAKSADDLATRQAAEEALKKDPANQPGNPQPKSEPTQEDIAKFKEILKDKGPLGDFARQQLKNALQKANDPAVRKAAEEALKNQGGRGEPSAKDIEDFQEMLKDKGPLGDMLRQELPKIAEQMKDDTNRRALEDALKKSAPGPGDQAKKDLSEKDIAQLKDLLKKDGPAGDFARDALEKAASNAKDDAARAAAREALKQDQAGKEPSAKDVARLKDLVKEKGAVGDAAANELGKIAQNAKDDATRQDARNALKSAGRDDILQPTKPAPTGQANAPKADPSRDVTLKEITDLEKMGNKQGMLGDMATRELAEAKRLAKDPKVRQAAEDALKRLTGQPGVEPNQDDVSLLREMLKEKGQLGDAAQRELSRLAAEASNPEVRDAAANALKEAQRKPSNHDPFRDAKSEDVAAIKKNVNKEGLQGDIAAQNLSEIARSAKDEKVRKEAQEALKSRDPQKTEPATPEDVAQLKRLLDDKGPIGDAVAREMARLAKEGINPEARAAAAEALKASNRDPVTLHHKETLRPNLADPDAAKRGGDLTLEELKNQVTPEMLKKLGITPEEFNRILKNQEDRQRAAKEDPLAQRGDPSLLPGTAPRLTDPAMNNNASSIQGNRGQPPPGFGDVYNRWTTGRKGGQ